jgi:diguanylate cyclase (GGDEF)-like protein
VDEQLPRLLARAGDASATVTVALLDLDHFKWVNDTLSHEIGDRVLCAVAELLREADLPTGPDSFAARMGGEEFLLVLVGGDPASATRHLEDVRRTVRTHPWAEVTGGLPVTFSIGATGVAPMTDHTPAEVLGRADGHLYLAKRSGRDRVVSDEA